MSKNNITKLQIRDKMLKLLNTNEFKKHYFSGENEIKTIGLTEDDIDISNIEKFKTSYLGEDGKYVSASTIIVAYCDDNKIRFVEKIPSKDLQNLAKKLHKDYPPSTEDELFGHSHHLSKEVDSPIISFEVRYGEFFDDLEKYSLLGAAIYELLYKEIKKLEAMCSI